MSNTIFEPLLPLHGLGVTLEFLDTAEFSHFHQMTVDAFNRHLLGSNPDYKQTLTSEAPESGRLRYTIGDTYTYSIMSFAGQKAVLTPLFEQLKGLPNTAPITDKAAPLRNNIKVTHINDLFDGNPITHPNQCKMFSAKQLNELIAHWQPTNAQYPRTLKLQWLSPARLMRDSSDRSQLNLTGEARFCRELAHLSPVLLLKRIVESLTNLMSERGESVPPLEPTLFDQLPLSFDKSDLFWLDTPYYSKDKQDNIAGGMLGNISLIQHAPLPQLFWQALILGQYLGVGQRRVSGFGKYQISEVGKPNTTQPSARMRTKRSQHLLGQALKPNIIRQATLHLKKRTKQDSKIDEQAEQLRFAIDQLVQGTYQAPPLFGQEIPKKNGGTRFLAVAPLYDRILQKAAALVLTPAIDAILYQGTYAYRKGRSRQQVAREVLDAVKQGYNWIYESDVTQFFDEIDRTQLIQRLESIFGTDPLINAVRNWLGTNVVFNGQHLPRPKGIPQGSALSPLLANFMLDDFDSDLDSKGFKLIRFADDFIVLCKSQMEAELAATEVNRSLSDIGLTINKAKSHIVSFEQGFKFVGYLFQDKHALDLASNLPFTYKSYATTSHTHSDEIPPWEEQTLPTDPDIFTNEDDWHNDDDTPSWESVQSDTPVTTDKLVQSNNIQRYSDLFSNDSGSTSPVEAPETTPTNTIDDGLNFESIDIGTHDDGEFSDREQINDEQEAFDQTEDLTNESLNTEQVGQMPSEGTFFTLTGESSMLSLDNGRVIVKRDEVIIHRAPIIHLSGMLLFGNHHLTTPLIKACLTAQLPIHLASRMGNYEGAIWKRQPIDNSYKGWFAQIQYFDNEAQALDLAKATVHSRLFNMLVLLQRYNKREEIRAIMVHIESLKRKIKDCDTLASLLGIEGNATKSHFAALSQLLPSWCAFDGRNRRPPKDPFNVLLSYGYTWLYAHTDAILTTQGFLTWKGYYHQPSSGHAALASDIIESYRHLIERAALTSVNNKMIQLEDFRMEDEQLRLGSDARKTYLRLLESYFLKTRRELTVWQHIHTQAKSLWQQIDHIDTYIPYKEYA